MTAMAVTNAAAITFPKATGAGTTLTHFSISTGATAGDKLLYRKALANNIPITANVTQPQFPIGALSVAVGGDVSDLLTELWAKHIFQNAAVAGVGDVSGLQPSASAGTLTVGLHTADPGAGGNPTTNAADYTGYAAQTVARSAAGWTVA